MLKRLRPILLAALALLMAVPCGCDKLDDDRIPLMPVYIAFETAADWDVYGVAGALSSKEFIKDKRLPRNYPYTALSQTGFGGVLLLTDVLGSPAAYDLACPVERNRQFLVEVDPDDEYLAVCHECGSKYNVFSLRGHPVEGPAARHGYALRPYSVGKRGNSFMVVGN